MAGVIMAGLTDIAAFQTFLHRTQYDDLPEDVQTFAQRCLLDLIGVAVGGTRTKLSRIIRDHAAAHFGAGEQGAPLWFDGRTVSLPGAALSNGMTIDSLDAHDGFKPAKGHVGCSVLPSLVALASAGSMDGKAFLAHLVVGYEIGSRAAVALHESVEDYHTSGAWGAVACAALASRVLNFDAETTRHAMGIAEYHGPRSQMMRVIDHPTMLKDGSGWGAMAGVSAALLAQSGFTGAPAITVEAAGQADVWSDLGERWTIKEQYFKPYPVCRWAQPAVAAALELKRLHGFDASEIVGIEVTSFHEATRLACREPANTEQAQYSLPFPLAAALVHGTVGPAQISDEGLTDRETLRLSNLVSFVENADYNAAFPEQRYAHVHINLQNGARLVSDRTAASGDPEDPLSDTAIRQKFRDLAEPQLGRERAIRVETAVQDLASGQPIESLLDLLSAPA